MPPKQPGSRESDELNGDTTPEVFLNVPYDAQFADLFLAYIAGLVALGLYILEQLWKSRVANAGWTAHLS